MKAFEQALELVVETLAQLKKDGVDLRASVSALRQLERSESPRIHEASPVPAKASVPPRSAASPAASPAASAPASRAAKLLVGNRAEALEALKLPALACNRCPHLVKSRSHVVFGEGNPEAELLFVGDSPDEEDDQQGTPLSGKSGQLLTKIIETMGLSRAEVYLSHVLKCRPDSPAGESRKPRGEEMSTCLPYLKQQIEIIRPKVIVALGATAMEGLLGKTEPMARLRGIWHEFEGIPLMATYHPAYLLRNQALAEKRKVWEDMLLVLERLQLPISAKQRGYFLPK